MIELPRFAFADIRDRRKRHSEDPAKTFLDAGFPTLWFAAKLVFDDYLAAIHFVRFCAMLTATKAFVRDRSIVGYGDEKPFQKGRYVC
jgi:hypothetical protein